MPDADEHTLLIAAIWLIGQCSVFVRNRDQLAELPLGLSLNEAGLDQLAQLVSRWVIGGLGR